MKNKLLTLAGALAVIAVLGHFYAKPLLAQVRAALVQDVDQPARAPFQTHVDLFLGPGGGSAQVTIPPGQRLVVDFIGVHGIAQGSGGVQPDIILLSSVGGGPSTSYDFAPQQSSTVGGRFDLSQPATIYADSLNVNLAFAGGGAVPSSMAFEVQISGHLIKP
jgi:hypothetical protein